MDRKWLEDQIIKLENQLGEAQIRKGIKKRQPEDAEFEYGNAREAVESLSACLGGLRDEPDFVRGKDAP